MDCQASGVRTAASGGYAAPGRALIMLNVVPILYRTAPNVYVQPASQKRFSGANSKILNLHTIGSPSNSGDCSKSPSCGLGTCKQVCALPYAKKLLLLQMIIITVPAQEVNLHSPRKLQNVVSVSTLYEINFQSTE